MQYAVVELMIFCFWNKAFVDDYHIRIEVQVVVAVAEIRPHVGNCLGGQCLFFGEANHEYQFCFIRCHKCAFEFTYAIPMPMVDIGLKSK